MIGADSRSTHHPHGGSLARTGRNAERRLSILIHILANVWKEGCLAVKIPIRRPLPKTRMAIGANSEKRCDRTTPQGLQSTQSMSLFKSCEGFNHPINLPQVIAFIHFRRYDFVDLLHLLWITIEQSRRQHQLRRPTFFIFDSRNYFTV